MEPRAAALIERLGLQAHPEGGYYREIYRSPGTVSPGDPRSDRAALTTIYFLLPAGQVSRWHRVGSDEVWHYYEGDPLELLVANERFDEVAAVTIGPIDGDREPIHVVAAGRWQAARTTGAYTLVGCTVAPGFDFDDFALLEAEPAAVALASRSRHAALIRPFLPT
ncbi:MAG: cupin domain-containing protein [Vicinamibacterales bacterium]